MDRPAPSDRLDELLAHREWVRRVARALVGDESRAEDLEQETWLRALDAPAPRSPRAWLGTVLRRVASNMRRGEGRRGDREAAAPVPEAPPTPEELLGRAEVVERVARAVRGLEEPYRTTILLRYFEDLAPVAIAARLGEPAATVRVRLHRGRERLRARLEAENRGDRRYWAPALAALAREPRADAGTGAGAAAGVAGGILMKKAMAAAVVAALLAGGVLWNASRETRTAPGSRVVSVGEPAPAGAREGSVPGPRASEGAGSQPSGPQDAATPSIRGRRRVAWPIVAGECPVPPDGTVVPLRPIPGAGDREGDLPAGRMVGSDLVVGGLPDERFWNALAVGPDGSLARLFVDSVNNRGRETSFRKARRIEVFLREEDGSPVEGALVEVRESGNNRMEEPARSGADGVAVLEGLPAYRATVLLTDSEERHAYGVPVGTVDLDAGDGRLEVVLRPLVEVRLSVTVDGEPRVPERLGLRFDGGVLAGRVPGEVPGALRVTVRPVAKDPVLAVHTWAEGLAPHRAVPERSAPGEPFAAVLALESEEEGRAALRVRIVPPADGRARWEVRRLDDPRGVMPIYGPTFLMAGPRIERTKDGVSLANLEPGRYQVVDASGLATEVLDLRAGEPPREVVLDLSRTTQVTGRVLAPPDTDLRQARVVVEGEGLAAPSGEGMARRNPGALVAPDGTFRARVPGDRPFVLRAAHPSLAADPATGAVGLDVPRDGIVLRLVEGTHAVLRLEPDPVGPQGGHARLLLFRGEPGGVPVSEHILEASGDGYRFGNYPPGTYTVWIDAPGGYFPGRPAFAPRVLRDISLGRGRTDLGTVHLEEGATIRFTILPPDGGGPPNMFVVAVAESEPRHTRGMNYFGNGELVVGGLGRGRFRVTATPSGTPPTVLFQAVVDSEGSGEIALTLDLR